MEVAVHTGLIAVLNMAGLQAPGPVAMSQQLHTLRSDAIGVAALVRLPAQRRQWNDRRLMDVYSGR